MIRRIGLIILLLYPSINALAGNDRPSRHEFYPYVGGYFGDSLESSLLIGGEYIFLFSRNFGVGADFGYTKADFKENRLYSQPGFFTNDNIYLVDITGMASIPATLQLKKHTIDSNLLILLGGGTININSSYEPHGFIGAGVEFYLGRPWLAWRTDVRTTFHTTGKPNNENEFDVDVLLTTGLSFQLCGKGRSNP